MKRICTICIIVTLAASSLAQIPQKMSYQAVIRDASDHLVTDRPVGVRISLLKGSSEGSAVYIETHSPVTNSNGLVSIEIGGGTPVSGTFSAIDWSTGIYYVKTETDPGGGTDYSITGTSQLLSVPFALQAKNVVWKSGTDHIYYSGGNVGINTREPYAALDVMGQMRSSSEDGRFLSLDVPRADINAYINSVLLKTGKLFFSTNGVNRMALGSNGRLGIGTDTPEQLLDVNGNAIIKGDLFVNGSINGNYNIDISQITGLTGQSYTSLFPDVLYNTATVEIYGTYSGPLLVVSTVGFETDRISIPTFIDHGVQHYREEAGLSMELPIAFETGDPAAITALKSWFDGNRASKVGSIIIYDLAGNEKFRWNFFEYIPDRYEAGTDGRTRFIIKNSMVPNTAHHLELAGFDVGNQHSYNQATDKLVEIQGMSLPGFSPAVTVDEVNRTITLTMDYNEGAGIFNWAKAVATGTAGPKFVSIIETLDGVTEISRKNYFECITVKWELIYGFGLNVKLKSRVVIAYGLWENA